MSKGSYDLLPGRIQSDSAQLFERTMGVIVGLIVTAATIIGVVEGFGNSRCVCAQGQHSALPFPSHNHSENRTKFLVSASFQAHGFVCVGPCFVSSPCQPLIHHTHMLAKGLHPAMCFSFCPLPTSHTATCHTTSRKHVQWPIVIREVADTCACGQR
jgi:hypothetical protein